MFDKGYKDVSYKVELLEHEGANVYKVELYMTAAFRKLFLVPIVPDGRRVGYEYKIGFSNNHEITTFGRRYELEYEFTQMIEKKYGSKFSQFVRMLYSDNGDVATSVCVNRESGIDYLEKFLNCLVDYCSEYESTVINKFKQTLLCDVLYISCKDNDSSIRLKFPTYAGVSVSEPGSARKPRKMPDEEDFKQVEITVNI